MQENGKHYNGTFLKQHGTVKSSLMNMAPSLIHIILAQVNAVSYANLTNMVTLLIQFHFVTQEVLAHCTRTDIKLKILHL